MRSRCKFKSNFSSNISEYFWAAITTDKLKHKDQITLDNMLLTDLSLIKLLQFDSEVAFSDLYPLYLNLIYVMNLSY